MWEVHLAKTHLSQQEFNEKKKKQTKHHNPYESFDKKN